MPLLEVSLVKTDTKHQGKRREGKRRGWNDYRQTTSAELAISLTTTWLVIVRLFLSISLRCHCHHDNPGTVLENFWLNTQLIKHSPCPGNYISYSHSSDLWCLGVLQALDKAAPGKTLHCPCPCAAEQGHLTRTFFPAKTVIGETRALSTDFLLLSYRDIQQCNTAMQ